MANIVIEMPGLFTPAEAAKLLGVGQATAYRWLKQDKLQAINIDHQGFIPRSEILRLLIRKCSTCSYHQEFGHCSVRMAEDVEVRPGKCHDWALPEILTKRS